MILGWLLQSSLTLIYVLRKYTVFWNKKKWRPFWKTDFVSKPNCKFKIIKEDTIVISFVIYEAKILIQNISEHYNYF